MALKKSKARRNPNHPPPLVVLQRNPTPGNELSLTTTTTTTTPRTRQPTKFTDYQRLIMRQLAMSLGWKTQRTDRDHIQVVSQALSLVPEVIKSWIRRNRKPHPELRGQYVEKEVEGRPDTRRYNGGKPRMIMSPPDPPVEQRPSSSQAIVVRGQKRKMRGGKKPRFTEEQSLNLREFARKRGWNTVGGDRAEIEELSQVTGLTAVQIKSWVRNHRRLCTLTKVWVPKRKY